MKKKFINSTVLAALFLASNSLAAAGDPMLDAARGYVTRSSSTGGEHASGVNKFGANAEVTKATTEDI